MEIETTGESEAAVLRIGVPQKNVRRIANAALAAGDMFGRAQQMAERFNALAPAAVRETRRPTKRPPGCSCLS